MNKVQIRELLLQALEHEVGGVKIYTTALKCVMNADLKQEWEKYRTETQTHVERLTSVCAALNIDPSTETPGRQIVRFMGASLVEAMEKALAVGKPQAAELVACDCVTLAEAKDHLNWNLIGKCADQLEGEARALLKAAYAEIEDQEDDHYYHSRGWCRELWLQSLGLNAVLPPPEERLHVKTAIGAAKAEQSADLERQRLD